MKILFIGDIFAKAGRSAVLGLLPGLRKRTAADIVIANAENTSGGRGIHPRHLKVLIEECGIDLLTSGNHIYDAKEIVPLMNDPLLPLLRPLNYPRKAPGRGYRLMTDRRGVPLLVVNIMGRVFMDPVDCPFQSMEDLLAAHGREAKIVIVDLHAETTSEKRAFAWYFNGKVSAILGTHTHVQTADEEILDGGTAYISDVGMTGPYRSVIGMDMTNVLKRFTAKYADRAEAAEGDARLSAVYVEVDDTSGKACAIERIQERLTL